ncbi:hypothetical protein A2996_01995 [Candidatus Campbellbacteria bacterium RIFCSPLOWO2_01_FULL_34_15]|uniref:Uncharacterized protein n=1 Tax=Candidatus Campbellbacteria bacterium RIFCSPLOWO2_01_FULL_34_15 TaxID=1797579 RepID=A0A1F5EPZ2_9BACT|nr:MAG: hypothetical protein A2996_01995 [Candidatus Campbellbacteria bacterium RIFCSPLOWO2_01_FULL_34_15]
MDETIITKAYSDILPGEVFFVGETFLTKKITRNGKEKESLIIADHICGECFRETRSEAGPLFKFFPNERFEIIGNIVGTKTRLQQKKPKTKSAEANCRH